MEAPIGTGRDNQHRACGHGRAQCSSYAGGNAPGSVPTPDTRSAEKKSALREQALADAGVQTMLEVFPAEIRDVEEM